MSPLKRLGETILLLLLLAAVMDVVTGGKPTSIKDPFIHDVAMSETENRRLRSNKFKFSGDTYTTHEILAGQMRKPRGDEYCFFSFGCWGGKDKRTQGAVAKAMGIDAAKTHPLFVIAAGDNFYEKGVKNVQDPRFDTTFESVYTGDPLVKVPWFVAYGNHDYRGNISAQIDYTFSKIYNKNRRWYLPSRYYSSKDLAGFPDDLLLIVLDGPLLERCHNNGDSHQRCTDHGAQRKWLEDLLEEDQRQYGFRWRVVVNHYPMYANGPHINFQWMKAWLTPLLEKYCVSQYINADNHYLQLSEKEEVFYVNSGGGAGYGKRHTPKDKNYKIDRYNKWEKIGDGFVRHCVRNPASQEHHFGDHNSDGEDGEQQQQQRRRVEDVDRNVFIVDEFSQIVSTFINEKNQEVFTYVSNATTLSKRCHRKMVRSNDLLVAEEDKRQRAAKRHHQEEEKSENVDDEKKKANEKGADDEKKRKNQPAFMNQPKNFSNGFNDNGGGLLEGDNSLPFLLVSLGVIISVMVLRTRRAKMHSN